MMLNRFISCSIGCKYGKFTLSYNKFNEKGHDLNKYLKIILGKDKYLYKFDAYLNMIEMNIHHI